ncbi:hypothetical protein TNCV_3007481 [Trichonephila clavipes]|nr:hypothetical protein TNCV_3007481 [Trichonephila clavipes]
MADVQYLKYARLYTLKLEAATQASRRDHQSTRGAGVTLDAPCESSWKIYMEKLRDEFQTLMRKLPDNEKPHYKILQITAVNGGDKELYVLGKINNISCRMFVDTGANVSIIRKDLAQNSKVSFIWTPHCVSLQTLTGDKIQVHGKAQVHWKYRLSPYGIYSRYHRSLYSWTGFSEEQTSEDFGRIRLRKHRIDTGEHPPIKQHSRRLPFAKQEEVQELIKEMKDNYVIEPSSSPWSFPIVLVRNKDGSTRFCVDYRRLNNVTKKDSYLLPRIDDTLDTLAGNTLFSTLDLKSGYWQVEFHPDDKKKTAFTTGKGLW